MSQQGDRRTGREDDWWGQLYDEAAPDTGPVKAADTLDDRFASAARTVRDGAPPGAAPPGERPARSPGKQPGERAEGRSGDDPGQRADGPPHPRPEARPDPRPEARWTPPPAWDPSAGPVGPTTFPAPLPAPPPLPSSGPYRPAGPESETAQESARPGGFPDASTGASSLRPARRGGPVAPPSRQPYRPDSPWPPGERLGRPYVHGARPLVTPRPPDAPQPPHPPAPEAPLAEPPAPEPPLPERPVAGRRSTREPGSGSGAGVGGWFGPPPGSEGADTWPGAARRERGTEARPPQDEGADDRREGTDRAEGTPPTDTEQPEPALPQRPAATRETPPELPPAPPPPQEGTALGSRESGPARDGFRPDEPAAPTGARPWRRGPAPRHAAPGDSAPTDSAPTDTVPEPSAPQEPAAAPSGPPPAPPLTPTPVVRRPAREVPYVGDRPPTYEAEPIALPDAEPEALEDLVPDTVLEGARYGSGTLRAVSQRGDSARYRGEARRDALLVARFGTGENALVLVAMATGARATVGAHRAAADACRWIAAAVGRSHLRLGDDIRAARRGELKSGLHRLTDRSLGRLRARAAELGVEPEEYTASLRCLLLPADGQCRTRVFFGVGAGGLFRLRGGECQDLEPSAGDMAGEPLMSYGSPVPRPVPEQDADRLTVDLGIATPPSPYEPAPEIRREPFRFRASIARSGDALLLCSAGLAEPLRGSPELSQRLTHQWTGTEPPGLAAFLADSQTRVKGYADDRTLAAVWEK